MGGVERYSVAEGTVFNQGPISVAPPVGWDFTTEEIVDFELGSQQQSASSRDYLRLLLGHVVGPDPETVGLGLFAWFRRELLRPIPKEAPPERAEQFTLEGWHAYRLHGILVPNLGDWPEDAGWHDPAVAVDVLVIEHDIFRFPGTTITGPVCAWVATTRRVDDDHAARQVEAIWASVRIDRNDE